MGLLWDALTRDPHAGVSLVDAEGRLVYINAVAAELYFGPRATPEALVGRSLEALFDPAIAQERLALIEQVRREGRPAVLRSLLRGQALLAWLYPLPAAEEGDDGSEADGGPAGLPADAAGGVLVITRRPVELPAGAEGRAADDFDRVEAEVVDLGALDCLSRRELVVLALLGEGMTIDQVARHVHRSPKTIQTQRDSIANKLRLRSRAELVALVQRVGLTVGDAERPRATGGL